MNHNDPAWRKRVGFDSIMSEDELAQEAARRASSQEKDEIHAYLKRIKTTLS